MGDMHSDALKQERRERQRLLEQQEVLAKVRAKQKSRLSTVLRYLTGLKKALQRRDTNRERALKLLGQFYGDQGFHVDASEMASHFSSLELGRDDEWVKLLTRIRDYEEFGNFLKLSSFEGKSTGFAKVIELSDSYEVMLKIPKAAGKHLLTNASGLERFCVIDAETKITVFD